MLLCTTAMTCTHERDRTSVGTRRPRPSLFLSLFTVSPTARSQGGRSVTMRRAWFLQLTARIFFIFFFFEIRGDGTASHMRRWHGRSRAAESCSLQRHRPLSARLQGCHPARQSSTLAGNTGVPYFNGYSLHPKTNIILGVVKPLHD